MLARLAGGEVFGELALFDPSGLRSASVTALGPAVCFSISAERLRGVVARHPRAETALEQYADRLAVAHFISEVGAFAARGCAAADAGRAGGAAGGRGGRESSRRALGATAAICCAGVASRCCAAAPAAQVRHVGAGSHLRRVGPADWRAALGDCSGARAFRAAGRRVATPWLRRWSRILGLSAHDGFASVARAAGAGPNRCSGRAAHERGGGTDGGSQRS